MTLNLSATSSGLALAPTLSEAFGRAEPSLQEMLSFVLSRKLSTRLLVRALNVTLYIHQGKLEAASGYLPLGEVLVQQQVLQPEELPIALKRDESVGQQLLHQRRITGLQLRSALRHQARETLHFLFEHGDLRYELQEAQPLPTPNASLEGQDLLPQLLSQQPLSMRTVYQLADVETTVILEPACWRLLRWINGRRMLGKAIQAAQLPLKEAEEAARYLLQQGLIEQTMLLGLRFIVPKRLPLDSTKQPPSGLRANLFLKQTDGERSVWEIQEKLACPAEEVLSVLTTLYRERLIEIVQGEHEFNLLLDEF